MTIELRHRFQQISTPEVSFGPLRFIESLPWLVLAAAMRVVAFGDHGALWVSATIVATVATLHAFLVTTQRSLELAGARTGLGELDFSEQVALSRAILWRIGLFMIVSTLTVFAAGFQSFAPSLMAGVDGMAFDLFSDLGKFWSAAIAALVLLMIVDADRHSGKVRLFRAFAEFGRRGLWIGAAVMVLGAVYLGLGVGQGLVRSAIWHFWQTSASSQFIKNLIYFVFIFSFAILRLWITLMILTYGLKQSYVRA